jgi:hypothetical protein
MVQMLHIGSNRAIHMSKRFAQPYHTKQNMFLPGLVPKACQNHPPTSARHRSGKISFLRDHNVPNAGNMALGKPLSETLKQIILGSLWFSNLLFRLLAGTFYRYLIHKFQFGNLLHGNRSFGIFSRNVLSFVVSFGDMFSANAWNML